MRNPGETSEPRVESETTSEAPTKESERDDCSSPPCKRLKQAVLPFSGLSSSPSTPPTYSKASFSSVSNGTGSDNSESKPSYTCEEKPTVNGGLVTGAPSPPGVKPQATPDPAKVSKSLILENGVEKESASGERDESSISSPEANSSCVENELMIIDQLSPPAKLNSKNKVDGETPLLKSAEKQKRKEEREKERQEKQRLREEKLKEKQEEKALKEKERLEAKRKREQEKQEKQVEKERKEKERVEKREKEEKERLEKKEKRDDEKRKREEERNAKTEEKRKREAEKRSVEEEQERKRQKTQDNFSNYFFTKPSTSLPKVVQTVNNSRFKPFEIKARMSVAPVRRRQLSLDILKVLDEGLGCQEVSKLYLKELVNRKPIPRCTKRKPSVVDENTESNSDKKMPEESIVIDENSNSSIEIIEPKKKVAATAGLRNKLLQFHTNYRPAYFGTWRKKSKKLSPKNPFKKDMELFDYEVDSDDEWEEEEPGESLSNSEGEDEGDGGEEDNEDEDGFFVPHGYLSDDEGVEDEEMAGGGGENDEQGTNSENKKDQQLAKAKAWEAELKRKCKPMKAVTVGCLWLENASLNFTLKRFAACLLVEGPINVESISTSSKNNEVPVDSPSTMNNGALYVPDEALPDLIKLIHGNTAGLNKLMGQFRKQWTSKCVGRDITDEEVDEKSPISKRQLEKKIQNIATKERRTDRLRWYVHNHVLASFGLENLVVADGVNSTDPSPDAVKILVPHYTACNTPSIMQFTRPVSPALHRDTSPGQKHQIPKIKPASALHNSPSPMEVDSTSPSLNVSHCQQSQVSGFSRKENSKLCVENNLNNSQIGKPSLFTAVRPTSKTESVMSEDSSSGKHIETVCID